ncbi:MAG TPA: phosphodiester glycosidase family protein [Acidimicrobiales bacterium]|nr:phosphodiester glycosidase family protein [Acidimicrobiales bacterium]
MALAVLALTSFAPSAHAATPPNPPGWAVWELAPGVHHLLTERPGLVAHAARVQPGARVALRPVVAFDRVGGGHAAYDGRQPVTDLCARVGGIACVNGDFFNCRSCGQVAGGLVDRGRTLRSFRGDHEQVAITGGVPTLEAIQWVGSLRGTIGRDSFGMQLAALNRGPVPGAAVVYTPDWGPETPQVAGQVEMVFAAGGPHTTGVRALVPVARRPVHGAIPRDGVVVAANGRAAEQLNWLWSAWHKARASRTLVLDTALSEPADVVVGGHPVVLRGGVRQPLDPRDGMAMGRHPRTLLGWTAAGELLLVTIDGRQPGYSDGATLHEAVDLLAGLGATDAINLDGGGSSTFAMRCATGACVANRPSDGRQRPVPMALALVPAASGLKAASARPASAVVAPAPVAPPPVAPTAPTTTLAPPVVVPPIERAPADPVVIPRVERAARRRHDVALAPLPMAARPVPEPARSPGTSTTTVAAAAAALALATAVLLLRLRLEGDT